MALRSWRILLVPGLLWISVCQAPVEPPPNVKAFVGARLFDGTGAAPLENAVLLVRDGRVEAVGKAEETPVPEGVERIDLTGRTVIPGLINTHGHVGMTQGLESGPELYTRERILEQLGRYARYGVTTVVSLGDDGPAGIQVRDEQETPDLRRARLYVAGSVVTASTPEEAGRQVQELAALKVDFVKIRVDDFLGTREKMTPPVYQAVLEEAHAHGLPVAAHLYYLEDAKGLLRAGVDFLAHSIRDQPVDEELVSLLREKEVCLAPTLTREVSTFVYEQRPEFFDDPFFTREADPAVLARLSDPERQSQLRSDPAAQQYKKALQVAQQNLRVLVEEGIPIAMGTDSGPPGRFQGYFEHLELELMAQAGMTPEQILISATSQAARCLELEGVGSLQPGQWADLVVLAENPLVDIRNTRTIESVWIAGNRVP